MSHTCEVLELSEQQFGLFCSEWQDCLAASEADPVFASWPWCHSWWQTWSATHALELLLLTVRENQEIIGIAPLYRHRIKRRFGPSGYQLQFIGNLWRQQTVRSEHTGFILRRGREAEAVRAITVHLQSRKWDDMIICDHPPEMLGTLSALGQKVTLRGQDRGVCIDTTGSFQEWLGSLGSNTRLKLFNRRAYLGDRLRLVQIAHDDTADRESFFRLLSRLHLDRRQAQLKQAEYEFHHMLAECHEEYFRPIYSVMTIDGVEISALYDVAAGNVRYNLQSVFASTADKKISPGTLHLGFAIEESFCDPKVKRYDFLAGEGENTFYKERFIGNAGWEYKLMTSQVSASFRHKLYLKFHMAARRLSAQLYRTFMPH